MDPSNSAPELKRQQRRLRFILQIAISAALGGFLFGYDTAVINGAVGAIGEVFEVSSGDLGRAVAAALIGSAFGALAAGWLSDRIGRRRSMVVAAVQSGSNLLAGKIVIIPNWETRPTPPPPSTTGYCC